ncbi:hypothetical protein AB4170_25350, partial [Vibrio splendidus]
LITQQSLAKSLRHQPAFRNGLYTMMARSFLESHLVIENQTDEKLLRDLNSGLDCINTNGHMDLRIPSSEEIENQKTMISWDEEPTLEDRVVAYCEEHGASPRLKARLVQRMSEVMGDVEYEEDYFNVLINAEYKRFEKL